MMSAIALGYPAPVIVTWGWKPEKYSTILPTLAKLPGILEYLDNALSSKAHPADRLHHNDVVLFTDAHDLWFQLPPEVMLKRYHEINMQANARNRKLWKGKGPMPMHQTIIASAQKKCWPPKLDVYNPRCELLPESPLRKDLYGPSTDHPIDPKWPVENRPRYLNGGYYIGTAGDLQRMFRRAMFKYDEKIGKGLQVYSEQGITAEIFGEQESWRKWSREHAELKTDDAMKLVQNGFEYHLGIDYAQRMVVSTVNADRDGDIVSLNNKTAIELFSKKLEISPVRVTGIPDDIQKSENPLQDVDPAAAWGDMPLHVDFFTESIPAAIHHNAFLDGKKNRRITWWSRMWFFPHLRELVARQLNQKDASKPLARIQTPGFDITYYMSESNAISRLPRLFQGNSTLPLPVVQNFSTICQKPNKTEDLFDFPLRPGSGVVNGSEFDVKEAFNWWDEVFRDGQGPI